MSVEKGKEMDKNSFVDSLMDVIDKVADKVDLNGFASKVQDVFDKTDIDEKLTDKGIDIMNTLVDDEDK